MLSFLFFYLYHLHRFPVGHVEDPSCKHLVRGETIPCRLAAELCYEACGNGVYGGDAAVVKHAYLAEVIGNKVSKNNAILTFYEILKIFRLNECQKALRLPIFGYYQAETSGLFMVESR